MKKAISLVLIISIICLCAVVLVACGEDEIEHVRPSDCVDTNSDHNCDVCKYRLTDCEDIISNHYCDICNNRVTDCNDDNNDELCDVCGIKVDKGATNYFVFNLKTDDTYEILSYVGTPTVLEVPSTHNDKAVTSIGIKAFYDYDSLTSVTIPNSVKVIGESAFAQCDNLSQIVIPDSVTTLEYASFKNCSALTGVSIGNSVEIIGKEAFYRCRALDTLVIGSAVKTIGEYAFYDCDSLLSVVIPNSVTKIDKYAFGNCSYLTSIVLGTGLEEIVGYSFLSCFNLVEIYNLSSLDIVKGGYENGRVALSAFDVYASLEDQSKLSIDADGYIIHTDGAEVTLIDYVGKESDLILPTGITKIKEYALFYHSNIVSVVIPSTVTRIEGSFLANHKELTSITFEAPSNWYFSSSLNPEIESAVDLSDPQDNATVFMEKRGIYYKK